jgi:hypothetical protein
MLLALVSITRNAAVEETFFLTERARQWRAYRMSRAAWISLRVWASPVRVQASIPCS